MWITLVIVHGLLAFLLLGAITHQVVSVWAPVRSGAKNFVARYRAVGSANYANAVIVLCLVMLVLPSAVVAGGVTFGDDNSGSADDGPSYFGFVREVGGAGLADAEVSAALKQGGSIATRTDILGVYKIPGFAKDVNPDDVTISCAKDGYVQANVVRRPPHDAKDPIETECYLQKK